MLSLSADIAQQDVDLKIINGDGDGGILHGLELQRFAEAAARQDGENLTDLQRRVTGSGRQCCAGGCSGGGG